MSEEIRRVVPGVPREVEIVIKHYDANINQSGNK
jgi:hypothetical protein